MARLMSSVVINTSIYVFKYFTKYATAILFKYQILVLVFKHIQGVLKYWNTWQKNNQDLSKILQLLLIATVQFDSNINKMSP